jgi:hypothetical protein
MIWRRKKPEVKPPEITDLGRFVYDPKNEEWCCTLKNGLECTIYGPTFSHAHAQKLLALSKQEAELRPGLSDYMIQNWEGTSPVRGIEYLGAQCSEDGSISVSYAIETDDYGIIIDLGDDLRPVGHIWYD